MEGPVKNGDVELTSIRRAPCQRELTSVLRRLLIGPAAGRHRANAARRRVTTSARHRNVTSARRHYPTSGRRRAASALRRPAAEPMSKRRRHDIVPTSIPADVAHVVLPSPCFLRVTDWSTQSPILKPWCTDESEFCLLYHAKVLFTVTRQICPFSVKATKAFVQNLSNLPILPCRGERLGCSFTGEIITCR